MKTQVQNEQAVLDEAISVLLKNMPASKVVRLLASWQIGRGDYLSIREKLFEGETVDSLYDRIVAEEKEEEAGQN